MYLVVLFALLAVVTADDKTTSAYDNFDVDAVLNNERLFGSYFKCMMDRGRCTPVGLALKSSLPEAIQTDCEKCNENQKEITHKIMKFLVYNKKDFYSELEAKYDPEAKYRKKFKQRAEDQI